MIAMPPLIMHVVYRFAVGGLENGVVNLVNRLPARAWRHVIVSLTDIDRQFARRIERDDVACVAMDKGPGHAYRLYPTLFRLMRRMRPAIVHTRNLAALEASVPAFAAGVPVRVHGEHGWDVHDPDGSNARFRWVRRLYSPFVSHYVALSPNLADYLHTRIGIAGERIEQIYNGVDIHRFRPRAGARAVPEGCPFRADDCWIVGSVGRLEPVKDPANLARAFVRVLRDDPEARARLRLVLVGEGAQKREIEALLVAAGVRELAWLPGERADVPSVLQGLDCFVLPSLAEGVSNTILEAMATGLPVVATRVGANGNLVEDGATGRLVAAADSDGLAAAVADYYRNPALARSHGAEGRRRAEREFSLDRMVQRYDDLYAKLLRSPKSGWDEAPRGAPDRSNVV